MRPAIVSMSRPWLADNPVDRLIDTLHRLRSSFAHFANGPDHWYPTLAATAIRTPSQVVNRIPEFAEATCDIRFPPPHTSTTVLELIASQIEPSVHVEKLIVAEPVELSPDPLYLKVSEEVTGQPVRLIREDGGSDARFLCKHGIAVIMSRPLVGDIHSEREWIEIASMEKLHRIYSRYLVTKLAKKAER